MKVFIVEDDPLYSIIIRRLLQDDDTLNLVFFDSGKSLLTSLGENPDVVTLDLGLPDIPGVELFEKIKQFNSEIEVVVISGQDDINVAVGLLKDGAYDYLVKDSNLKERLHHSFKQLKKKHTLQKEVMTLRTQVSGRFSFKDVVIGESSSIQAVEHLIKKAIKINNINVSVYGEQGCGKRFVAQVIHYNSSRRDFPFVVLNVEALNQQQQVEALFGVEAVDMLGRSASKKGKIEEAAGGTIYIENVDNLTLDVQLFLLDLLKSNSYYSWSGFEMKELTTRVIVSSLLSPTDLLHRTSFSSDLFYYLAGLSIHLPPLRKRKRDIILLADHFLQDFCVNNGLGDKELTAQARRKLLNYFYPVNVRELKTIIDLAAVLSNDKMIDQEHITFNTVEEEPLLEGEELTMREYNDVILRHFLKKYKNVMTVAQKLEIGKSSIYNFLKSERGEE